MPAIGPARPVGGAGGSGRGHSPLLQRSRLLSAISMRISAIETGAYSRGMTPPHVFQIRHQGRAAGGSGGSTCLMSMARSCSVSISYLIQADRFFNESSLNV